MDPARLIAHFYAPALRAGDARGLAVVHALEASLPGVRLDHVVGDRGQACRVPERDALVDDAARRRELPFLFHHDEGRYVRVHGNELHARMGPGRSPLWEVHVSLPLAEGVAALVGAVAAVGREAEAWWGVASPEAATVTIALQIVHPGLDREPPAGLPRIHLPAHLSHPRIPQRLGWLDYWSPETAAALGFPDPERDQALVARSRSDSGGWVIRLTEEPLDLDRPEDVAALRSAYERFPEVGGRGEGGR